MGYEEVEVNAFQKILYKNNKEFMDDYETKLKELAYLENKDYEYLISRMQMLIKESGDTILKFPAEYWVKRDLDEIKEFHDKLNIEKMDFLLRRGND